MIDSQNSQPRPKAHLDSRVQKFRNISSARTNWKLIQKPNFSHSNTKPTTPHHPNNQNDTLTIFTTEDLDTPENTLLPKASLPLPSKNTHNIMTKINQKVSDTDQIFQMAKKMINEGQFISLNIVENAHTSHIQNQYSQDQSQVTSLHLRQPYPEDQSQSRETDVKRLIRSTFHKDKTNLSADKPTSFRLPSDRIIKSKPRVNIEKTKHQKSSLNSSQNFVPAERVQSFKTIVSTIEAPFPAAVSRGSSKCTLLVENTPPQLRIRSRNENRRLSKNKDCSHLLMDQPVHKITKWLRYQQHSDSNASRMVPSFHTIQPTKQLQKVLQPSDSNVQTLCPDNIRNVDKFNIDYLDYLKKKSQRKIARDHIQRVNVRNRAQTLVHKYQEHLLKNLSLCTKNKESIRKCFDEINFEVENCRKEGR